MQENEVYTSYKLGYGVDATEPAPLRDSPARVRAVQGDLSNIEEAIKNEKRQYREIISSMASHKTSVNLSVSDLVGKVLTLSAEAEYSREASREMVVKGNEKIHRDGEGGCEV